jgi:hypothetical protein
MSASFLLYTPAFLYRETHEKVNISWNENRTISYRQKKWWYFDPDISNGTLRDNVTTLNAVALVRFSLHLTSLRL